MYFTIENGHRQRDMDISLVAKISGILKISMKQILKFEQSQRTTKSIQ